MFPLCVFWRFQKGLVSMKFYLAVVSPHKMKTWLRSNRWPIHIRAKWVPWVFPPWVNWNSRVRLEPPSRSWNLLRGKMENLFSVARGSDYCDYPYFPYPNNPVAYPLSHTCRYLRQNIQIWRWWWRQSGFSTRFGWERHLLSPNHPSPDGPPPLIWYIPVVLRFLRVHRWGGRLSERSTGAFHALHYDVKWGGLCCCR